MNCWSRVLILTVCLCCSPAFAHKPSDSYLRIQGGAERLTAEWDIALKDLEYVVGLDANRDGDITWGELKSRREAVTAHVLSRLRVSSDRSACELQVTDLRVTHHSDGAYAVLSLNTDCPGNTSLLAIHYNLLFDIDPTHRGLVLFNDGRVTSTHVLSPESPSIELRAGEAGLWEAFRDYVREGVWHIWIGFDHILFLVSLLLPAVLVYKEQYWRPVAAFRPACTSVLKIVTMFTLAHSITLWLAVMEYVSLPGRYVESAIALSIIVTAMNNLYPVLSLPGWVIAFVFGLVHGFGFANVLIDLGLDDVTLGVSLFGFNVGVELGQLAIVLIFLPLAYLIRSSALYRTVIFKGGSVLIAVIAGLWMYERLFNVEILG